MRPDRLVLLFSLCAISLSAFAAVQEPAGYRLERYDSEVPDTLSGAQRVTAVDVHRLMMQDGAAVIDVIPEHRKPDDLPEGQVWFPVEHRGIAGAVWLPDVGYGVLSEITENYLRRHLESISEGRSDHPMVFYCRTDCWMSWNTAKRAVEYGYTRVYWFADGIEDWLFEDFDTEVLTPAAGQRQAIK
ncbi:rhodanese-like domain-containing protein [Granulosicoccus sp. 3-233]|uniref:rhodanese-like domain-containing protein n=1 Tax=Granulosicoccus sp. 3-233 TaxID=3417969 RepID=UPI003D334422